MQVNKHETEIYIFINLKILTTLRKKYFHYNKIVLLNSKIILLTQLLFFLDLIDI